MKIVISTCCHEKDLQDGAKKYFFCRRNRTYRVTDLRSKDLIRDSYGQLLFSVENIGLFKKKIYFILEVTSLGHHFTDPVID